MIIWNVSCFFFRLFKSMISIEINVSKLFLFDMSLNNSPSLVLHTISNLSIHNRTTLKKCDVLTVSNTFFFFFFCKKSSCFGKFQMSNVALNLRRFVYAI